MQNKNRYQAYSAAISNDQQVPVVLEYLNKRERFQKAKNKIFAYRVNQVDENTHNMDLFENYEDDGEDGAGEKLLHLLQKMGVENIFIVV
jgi:putative IMPACT (imprinted ancient) family translation regulator